MKIILRLQSAMLKEINYYETTVKERSHYIDWERVHMVSCATIGYHLALKRGVDPILAAAACTCHDYGRIITGKQTNHANNGYQPVESFLRKTKLFNEEQIEQIAIAVKNHSKKEEVGSPLEEVVKDADVLDFYQYGFKFATEAQKKRVESLLGHPVDVEIVDSSRLPE